MLPSLPPASGRGDRKLDIARKVASELFAEKYHASVAARQGFTAEELQQQAKLLKKRERGMRRTLKLISDPQCNAVYSMKTEMRLITERNIEIMNNELAKLSDRENLKFSALVQLIDHHMQMALFGCSIDIGICTDSTARVIEFFGDPNYRRKVRRGDSNCFTAIDRKDVVVEAITKTKKNPLVHFAEGDHVVYIPMFGTSSAQGVMEIYGLQTVATAANASHREVYQRSPTVLKAMIQAQDYKFVNTVRLWKKPPTTAKVSAEGEVGKFYGVDAFIVAGHVTGVAHGRRGVPYYGGPRYTLTWENGEVDEEITATELLNHYKETPQSLGCSNTLDAWLSDNLYDIATAAGHILESQRIKTFLVELRQRVQRNNLKANIIAEIGLESIASMLNGTREISLVGYNTQNGELNSLVDFFPVRAAAPQKTGKPEPVYQHTVYTISPLMFSRNPHSELLIVPDNHGTDWIALEMEVSPDFVWSVKANYNRYFIVLNRSKALNNKTSELDLMVVESVVLELTKAIKTLWQKEVRRRERKEVLKELDQKMFEWKTATVNELCYNVIQHISPHLAGADVYVGLVDPGGNSMTYVASSIKSRMEGKVLKRGEGVSFDVVDNLATIILRPEDLDKGKLLIEGSIVDVYYGRKLHRCKVEKVRGHEKFDVRFDCDKKVEAGVDVSRIVPHSFAFRMKKFGKAVYPFVCVALKNRTKALGVIGIDSFTQIPKADYEAHPEPDLVAFLEKIGSVLGANIDILRKKLSMQVLYTIAKNQFTEVPDVIKATFEVLFHNMTNVTGMLAARFVYEENEPKKTLGLHVLQKQGIIPADVMTRLELFSPTKSSLKAVQKYGEKVMWMLCRLRPAVRNEQGKIFLFCVVAGSPISEPDQEYMSAVQKLVAGTLQNIVSFKAVTEMRYESLREVRMLCENAHLHSRQKFFNLVVDSVQSCFYSANMYVGVLSPYNKSIDYILASNQSDMVGKSLVRVEKVGVSFRIVDELLPVSVGSTSQLAFNLFHFGPRQRFEFPYIGIPLIVDVDAMIGILGVDHCEDPSAVSDNLTDTTSFFATVGNYLGQVIRQYREEDARVRLLQIGREAKSFSEGIRQVKKVILELLPFAKRIVELAYEPVPAEITQRVSSEESAAKEVITQTVEGYTVALHVPTAFCSTTVAKGVQLKCIWQGHSVFSCAISPDGETQLAPATINIPQNVSIDIVKVQFVLTGTIAASEREIAHKEVDLVYLLNAPLYIMEHFLESTLSPTARVARFHLLSKVFAERQVVGFVVTDILVKGMNNLFETYQSFKSSQRQAPKELRKSFKRQNSSSKSLGPKMGDVFSMLRWNDEVILKTPSVTPIGELVWSNLGVYLKLDSSQLVKNQMQLELWDERKNGEPNTAYGRLDMAGNNLQEYLEGSAPFLELGALYPEGAEQSSATTSVIRTNAVVKLKGRVITAANMTSEHMLQEFSPSLRTKAVQTTAGAEKEKVYHVCEVCVLSARELGRRESWPATQEADVFAVVYFNGEEVGRSAVVRNAANPQWTEESFRLRVPGDEDLEQCVLLVELFHMDPATGVEETMGRVEVQGKALANFLTSNRLKCQWFDIEDRRGSKASAKSAARIPAQGELKLSGRPMTVDAFGHEDAKELGHMELSLLGFAHVRPPAESGNPLVSYRTFAVVYFNERKIHRSKLSDGAQDGQWEKERVIFRYPNSKPLFQCKLRIELWRLKVLPANKTAEVLIGSVELTGSPLGKLLGQKGLITKWLPVTVVAGEAPQEDAAAEVSFSPEVEVKGGPLGGKDIFEDCEDQLLLDVLAATRLPQRKDSGLGYDRRPSTFCEITWNSKKIGRTAVVAESINPLWDRQRFVMRIPLLTTSPDVSILSKCALKIELYDVWTDGSEVLCGALNLPGPEVESLFGQDAYNTQWYPLYTHKDRDGKLIETTAEDAADDTEACGAEIKLRGAKTGVTGEPKKVPDEHLLHVLSAQDLSNTDIFGGADPFVVVDWMEDAMGHTQIVPKSVNPVFRNEVFLLKKRADDIVGSPRPISLCLSVYSKLAVSTVPVFLGRVFLSKAELSPLMAADVSPRQQYTLTTSPELTEEENQLVKGSLTVMISKVKVFPPNIATKRDSLLWVVSAAHLPRTSAFGIESDVFCKVFRRYDREGADDLEVTQTNVAKSLNPIFKENYIPLEVPAYEDWSGFQLRVEVWDATNEPLGVLILRESEAQSLLARDDGELLTPVTFQLLEPKAINTFSPPPSAAPGVRRPNPFAAKVVDASEISSGPTITLAGGIREEFELAALRRRGGSPSQLLLPPANQSPTLSRARSTSESDDDTSTRLQGQQSGDKGSAKAIKGDDALVTIHALETSLEAKKMCCVFKWKGQEIGRTTTANPRDEELPWREEEVTITLDKDNALSGCTLDVEICSSHKRDLPLAIVSLHSADLAKLFDPALSTPLEFPIIDFKSSKSILGRKKAIGTLTLKGCIPKVQDAYDELHQDIESAAVEQEDPELLPLDLEVCIVKALNLATFSKIGRAMEVFATLHWRNGTEPVGKTEVVAGSANPDFDCEYFTLKKPQGVRLKECSLKATLFSKNILTAHTLLGETEVSGEELSAWLAAENMREFPLKEKSGGDRAPGHAEAPHLCMAIKKLPDLVSSHMYNNELPLPSHLIEVDVSVIAAHGLAKVNTLGLSNPYCKISWGRAVLGQTSVVPDTLAPVWEENESFIFRPPNTWDFKKKRRQTNSTTLITAPNTADMSLTIALYSSTRLGEDVFLGSAEIAGEELAKLVSSAHFSRKWFNLRTTKRLKQKEQKFVAGRVQLLITHRAKAGEGDFSGKDVELVVCSGRDLPKRKDNAVVDIYVRPRWNGRIFGKTFHSTDAAAPVWEDERFHSRLPGGMALEECTLELEVWQYQKFNSKSVMMGVVMLREEELRQLIETSNFAPQWFSITTSPFTPTALLNTNSRNFRDGSVRSSRELGARSGELSSSHLSGSFDSELDAKVDHGLGQLQIRCGFAGKYANVTDSMLPYELSVFGAKDLGKADMLLGLSDPYVICKWNGREIGRTVHAQRTIHPVWSDQKFLLMLDPNENIGQNLLQVEVWNHRVITKGEFLGCLYLTGSLLEDWFAGITKVGRLWSDLTKSPLLDNGRQHLVKGKIELGFQVKKKDTGSGDSVKDALNLQWREICRDDAGTPMMMFKVVSVQNLPVASGAEAGTLKGFLVGKSASADTTLACALSWQGDEVARTAPVTLTGDTRHEAKWADEAYHLRLPSDTDETGDTMIFLLQVLDVSTSSKPVVIGKLEFSFAMLWTLYGGEFTFPLLDTDGEAAASKQEKSWTVVGGAQPEMRLTGSRGSVTFRMEIMFPFWDSMRSIVPRTYLRKLSVCGASNLPLINKEPPNPKCVVMFDGAIKSKTITLLGNVAPSWPRVDVDILVDKFKPIEVTVILYHVSPVDKKEIVIGLEVIPFDYFLRPPQGQFDLFLGPSSKRQAEYEFTTSGSVKLQISGSNQLSESSLPYTQRLEKPTAALVVRDVRAQGREKLTKLDHELCGSILSPDERLWLGTASDFVSPQQLACKPEWVILPIRDIGLRIGPLRSGLIGTMPGFKFALGIERQEGKANVSDPMMLQNLSSAISECIAQLRKKDIYRVIREKALVSLRVRIQELATRADFSKDKVMALIYDVVTACFPGVRGRFAVLSQDAKVIEYRSFASGDQVSSILCALYPNQGADWDIVGRTLNRSLVASKYADFSGRPVAVFGQFPMCRFPRYSVPLRSGDAALGFFQLENFDVLSGGAATAGITEEGELRSWLEEIGDACGAAMYVGNEARVLANIEAFCTCWDSSINGLIADLVRDCFKVVQGCRLMEILSIDADSNVRSLLHSKPEGAKIGGSVVVLSSISIKEHVAEAAVASDANTSTRFGAMFRRRNAVTPVAPGSSGAGPAPAAPVPAAAQTAAPATTTVPQSARQDTTSSEDAAFSAEESARKLKNVLVGVRYEGTEQVHTATYDAATKSYLAPEIHLTLREDRVVIISMYSVDERLNVIAEYVGKVNFQTYQETELKGGLSAPVPVGSSAANPVVYDALVALHWPTKFEFVSVAKENSNIKAFKVHVASARDLQATDKGGVSNPFCEVLYGNKMIKQTEPKKKTLAPVWDEDIVVPYSGQQMSVMVDVYDMSFMRKGEFLGRVEIPHEHLMHCNGQEVEYALKPKANVAAKKQTKVGGVLKLSCSIVETTAAIRDREAEQSRKDRANAEIPKAVWEMHCPTIQLTVKSATDLARANRFGGSSDPFVLVFLGNDTDACEKTHFIDNTLNPKWNSVFNILLGVNMERGVTQVSSFPTIRLEVYDYNKVKTMDFLGSCEIPPSVYFSRKDGDFTLKPIARKKNDLVKGKLQAEFTIVDKVIQKKEHVYSFTPLRTLQTIVALDVHVVKAKGLMVANQVGNSDPYVILKWNNQVCGQTSVKINTLNPVWNGEKFVVNILTHGGFDVGEMSFEVWDKDFFKDGDFMGEAKVTSDVFMHPPSTPIDLTLQAKPGEDPVKGSKVQGTLTVKFGVRVLQQRPPCEQQEAREYKLAQPTLDPVTLTMAYDPDQETKRQKRDGLNFPALLDKATGQMDKYLNNPFERTGLISELHFGQLTEASRRAEQTVLKSPAADMVCVPTYRKGARPDQCFYLMARYEAGKIPRRDMQFMGKIHAMLYRGLCHINDREQRSRNLAELEKGMQVVSTATDNPSGIIVQTMQDVEVTMNCAVNLYLLGADGVTLAKCSPDIGEVDLETPPAESYIQLAARMCRYGFIIQKYRGDYSIVSTEWDAFNQLTMPPLASMSAAFDELEGPQTVKNFINACNIRVPDGAIFAPLMARGEVFLGLFVLLKVDAVPVANYRMLPTVSESAPQPASDAGQGMYTVVEKMEHGFTNSVKTSSAHFADGLLSSRLGTMYRRIKSFPVRHDTDPAMVIRYVFRLLVTAIPAIRTVSIWAVNLNKAPVLLFSKYVAPAAPAGILSRMISMSARVSMRLSGISSKKTVVDLPAPLPAAPVKKVQPSILSGMFGSESPQLLLATAVERAAFTAEKTTTRQSAVRDHKQIMAEVKNRAAEKLAKWKVDVPAALQKSNKRQAAVGAILENENEDEDDDRSVSTGSGMGGGAGAEGETDGKKEMSEMEENGVNLVHAEISRCVKVLQLKTFRVFTGHTLSALGSSAQSMDILSTLFPQLPADEEETPPEGAGTKTPVPPATGSPRGGPVPRAPLPPEPAPGKGGKPPTGATKRVPPGTAAPKPVGKRGQPAAPAGRGANAASPAPPAGDAAAGSASNKERLTSLDPASATPLVQRRARPPPTVLAIGGSAQKKKSKPHTFFVAANTDGFGGDSGWGVMGESMEKTLATVTELIESTLMKVADQRAKAESESMKQSEKLSPKEDASQSSKAKLSAGLGNDEVMLRPSMMLQRSAEQADEDEPSDGDDSMEEIE